MKLRTRLIVTYAILVFIMIFFFGFYLNYTIVNTFSTYEKKRMNNFLSEIPKVIYKQYGEGSTDLVEQNIDKIGERFLMEGIFLRYESLRSGYVWDVKEAYPKIVDSMLKQYEKNAKAVIFSKDGKYKEKHSWIVVNHSLVGKVTMGYYSPVSFTRGDVIKMDGLNENIILTGVIFFVVIVVIALHFERRIARPIVAVSTFTKKIALGNYGEQSEEQSKILEIRQLIDSINEMSSYLAYHKSVDYQMGIDFSHEMRTPLCIMQGQLEGVVDGVLVPNKKRMQKCLSEVNKLTVLVNSLSDLIRIESHEIKMQKEQVNLNDLLLGVLEENEEIKKEKKITITTKIDDNPYIKADYKRIREVLNQLIKNAILNSYENGQVIVLFYHERELSIIKVVDQGRGIPVEEQNKIFERFYRLDKARERSTGGVGIGLTMVNAIVMSHGGRVFVESNGLQGSTFTVELPIN